MSDRRRINGPPSGTTPPVFASTVGSIASLKRPTRERDASTLRKIFLKTGLTPSASGSAYLELHHAPSQPSLIPSRSSLKLTCTVHGPKPLPRSAPFSPQLVLSTHVKFAPFAARQRRGYVRDLGERDLGVHLEAALRGVVIGDLWPKSGVDVVVTVLESEEDGWWADSLVGTRSPSNNLGMLTTLAGCITAASAALVEAGIDCVDLITGGVAAVVEVPASTGQNEIVLDPCPSEHEIQAACVVGYLASRDELTELWMAGESASTNGQLVDKAVEAAIVARSVLADTLKESVSAQIEASEAQAKTQAKPSKTSASSKDVAMTG